MRTLVVLLLLLGGLSGCASVETKLEAEETSLETLLPAAPTEQGVVTVATLNPRSDFVHLPAVPEHVIWRRSENVAIATSSVGAGPTVSPQRTAPVEAGRQPIAVWPLLEEDMDLDSKIGEVPMCRRDLSGCEGAACDARGPVPCENPERFDCFQTKIGNYCLSAE